MFLGFGLAGAGHISVTGSIVALAGFAGGAVGGGRLGVAFGAHRGRLLAMAALVEVGVIAGAAGVAAIWGEHIAGEQIAAAPGLPVAALLAVAMGIQSAVARRIAVPDLTTTVLTMTITGFTADSPLAGGRWPQPGRRLLGIVAMLLGAALGGMLVYAVSVAAALAAAAALIALTGLVTYRVSFADAPWTAAS